MTQPNMQFYIYSRMKLMTQEYRKQFKRLYITWMKHRIKENLWKWLDPEHHLKEDALITTVATRWHCVSFFHRLSPVFLNHKWF